MAAGNMVVRNNIAALNVHRNMKNVGGMQMKASERLSSGYKINRASDDAAGLAISEKMRGQIRGLNQASKNVDDAISLVKTAEGGMQGIDDMIHRIRELLDFGSNDTNENNNVGTGDRQKIQDEIDQLVQEIDSMSDRVEFNKKKLIDGSWQDTSEQYNNAKNLVDVLNVEQTKADAEVTAMSANLTSMNAALTGAQASLSLAATSYSNSLSAFQTAKATYDGLVDAYNTAKTNLTNVLPKELSSDFKTWTTAAFNGLAPTKQGEIKAAIQAYADAAAKLGIDELKMGASAASINADFASVTAASLTGLANDWEKAPSGASVTGGISVYAAASSVMTASEVNYQGYVSKAQLAQSNVELAEQGLTNAATARANNQVKLGAAQQSLTAANDLKNLGTSRPLHFQIGANGGQSLFMSIGSLKSDTLGIGDGKGNSTIDVLKDTGADITATIDVLDQALSYVTTERSKLGAAVNRMEYTQQSLDITSENISDAESRIRDADMAQEMMNKTKADTLNQVAVAMMSQANQQPQSILQLLG